MNRRTMMFGLFAAVPVVALARMDWSTAQAAVGGSGSIPGGNTDCCTDPNCPPGCKPSCPPDCQTSVGNRCDTTSASRPACPDQECPPATGSAQCPPNAGAAGKSCCCADPNCPPGCKPSCPPDCAAAGSTNATGFFPKR